MNFDRAQAARHWRISILSRGGLTVSEVDELEDHLQLIEAELRDGMRPEEAFWLAAHRVGTPEALTREFSLVMPNQAWEVRAQWALLGLLAYWLVVPLVRSVVHLAAATFARTPQLNGATAALVLYAQPLALLLTIGLAVAAVRRLGASPAGVERALSSLASAAGPGLAAAGLGLIALQAGVALVGSAALSQARNVLSVPGRIAPLQSELWYQLLPVATYALPVLFLVLIVRLQRRLEQAGNPEPESASGRELGS